MSDLVKKTVKGTFWSGIESISSQIVSFLTNLILARLLFPEDYGVLGIVLIFTSITDVIVTSGFSVALIRKKERTKEDLSTAFFFNIIVGLLGYLILFVLAPYISIFFKEPVITQVLRVVGLGVVFNSFSIVQYAILTAELKLDVYTKINVITQIVCGVIGIFMAYAGYGIWALVAQTVLSYFIRMLLVWGVADWKPSLIFSKASFEYLWSFGSKLLFSSLIGTVFYKIYTFIIGKYVGKYELGLYTRADTLGQQPSTILNSILQKVMVPSLSTFQDDIPKLKNNYRKYVSIVSFIFIPFMLYCIAEAKPVFLLLFGSKWVSSAPIFQLLCLGFIWYPFSNMGLNLLQVLGKSDKILQLELYKKPVGLLVILCGIPFGLWGIVVSKVIIDIYCFFVNFYVLKKELDYNMKDQLFDVIKYFVASVPFFLIAYVVSKFDFISIINLVIVFLLGFMTYLGIVYLFKLEAPIFLKEIFLSYKKK